MHFALGRNIPDLLEDTKYIELHLVLPASLLSISSRRTTKELQDRAHWKKSVPMMRLTQALASAVLTVHTTTIAFTSRAR